MPTPSLLPTKSIGIQWTGGKLRADLSLSALPAQGAVYVPGGISVPAAGGRSTFDDSAVLLTAVTWNVTTTGYAIGWRSTATDGLGLIQDPTRPYLCTISESGIYVFTGSNRFVSTATGATIWDLILIRETMGPGPGFFGWGCGGTAVNLLLQNDLRNSNPDSTAARLQNGQGWSTSLQWACRIPAGSSFYLATNTNTFTGGAGLSVTRIA
jgi:hypothetical protein